jgi:16S rRNA (cytosine1402-N4)-methyltransferase
MLREILEMLNLKQNGIYVDATIGLGGHSEKILGCIGSEGKLIAIDKDVEALAQTRSRLLNGRLIFKRGSFSEMKEMLSTEGISEVDGILFDLGVSMLQLKDQTRGFSFTSHERLDMRMNSHQKISAWDVINSYPAKEIERILREFGEEPLSRKITEAIVRTRKRTPINTCRELSTIIEGVYRRRGKIHPATKTFQALRIAVNRELEELSSGLQTATSLLTKGGRLCVISYHSLEDRIVKHFMLDRSRQDFIKIITKKPMIPSLEEKRSNPSSRSAKLRVAERI